MKFIKPFFIVALFTLLSPLNGPWAMNDYMEIDEETFQEFIYDKPIYNEQKTEELKQYLNSVVTIYLNNNTRPTRAEISLTIRELLDFGANPNIATDSDLNGSQAIHFAAEIGDNVLISFLLEQGANIEAKNDSGRTPLHLAAWEGQKDAITLLFSLNANIEAQDNFDLTPLHLAAWEGHEEVIALLFSLNANIEAKSNSGTTPLHLAASRGHSDAISLLLSLNANIEAKDNSGKTPLLRATGEGHKEAIALLFSLNANIEAQDNSGKTPFHWAAWVGHKDAITLLFSLNANIEAQDDSGKTPLHLAAHEGHKGATALFIGLGAHNGKAAFAMAKGEAKEILSTWFSKESKMPGENPYYAAIRLQDNVPSRNLLKDILINSSQEYLDTLVNLLDTHKQTLLDIALAIRDQEIISFLLARKASPVLGRFNGLRMASRIPLWKEPTGHNQSLYEQILTVTINHYLVFLLALREEMPKETYDYIIQKIVLSCSQYS